MKKKLAGLLIIVVLALFVVALAADDAVVLSMNWTYNKDGRKRSLAPVTITYSVAGEAVIENVQRIGTGATGEPLLLGDVTDPGFAYFKNTDLTNFIEIGTLDVNTNWVTFLKLNTNEMSVMWLGTAAPRAKADTASARLDYVIADR